MVIFLTGANGFLGSYLTESFAQQGAKVIALVRPFSDCTSLQKINHLQIHRLDYSLDLAPQIRTLKSQYGEINYFIHNAGVTSSIDEQEYFEVNTALTSKMVDALIEEQLLSENGKFVYISSFAAHGPTGVGKPVSTYGLSKKRAEEYIQQSLLRHLIIRPTAIYGARDFAFLPIFKAAKKGIYVTIKKHQKISMIHAKDLADGILDEIKSKSGIIHFDDGRTYHHRDLLSTLQVVLDRKLTKLPLPSWLCKIFIYLSDQYHFFARKRPGITLEKFNEISQNWNLREECKELIFSEKQCEYNLERGFSEALEFYKSKKLL